MKRIKDSLFTYWDHLSERERWMLLTMSIALIFFTVYLSYYFLLHKKMVLLENKVIKKQSILLDVKEIGERYLIEKRNKRRRQKPKKRVKLYTLLGDLVSKNGVEIKSIDEVPVTQNFPGYERNKVKVEVNRIYLDRLTRFMAGIENMRELSAYINQMTILRNYSDPTKIDIKFSVTSIQKKEEPKKAQEVKPKREKRLKKGRKG